MYLPIPQAESPVKAASVDDSTQIPLGPVIRCVVIASMGAFSFGYHLGVVNGPLGAIAADLGFADNAGLQGAVSAAAVAPSDALQPATGLRSVQQRPACLAASGCRGAKLCAHSRLSSEAFQQAARREAALQMGTLPGRAIPGQH